MTRNPWFQQGIDLFEFPLLLREQCGKVVVFVGAWDKICNRLCAIFCKSEGLDEPYFLLGVESRESENGETHDQGQEEGRGSACEIFHEGVHGLEFSQM